jgi:hypothetical protein
MAKFTTNMLLGVRRCFVCKTEEKNREDGEEQVQQRKTFDRPKLRSEHKGKGEAHAKLQMHVVSGSYTFKKEFG